MDPREHKVELLGPTHPDVTYLPASTCHPKYFDHLGDGPNVVLWHIFSTEADSYRVLPRGEWTVLGGSNVGLRAMALARFFGFKRQIVFGMDGCQRETKHAAPHPLQDKSGYSTTIYEGVEYKTTPAMLESAKGTFHELDTMPDVEVEFRGEGLVQEMAKRHVRRALDGKKFYLAINKPALISAEYREQNKQLHHDNLAYGVGAGDHAKTVLKMIEKTGCKSVLDYGCGKGYLAKALDFPIWEYDPAVSGKDEAPRPADLVCCFDVLEHVEPDKLFFVLDDLKRVVLRVGYFTIHMGPAKKTLPDGRNTHLIQQNRAWWKSKLKKFFQIGTILERGPELHVVVAPKAQGESEGGVVGTLGPMTPGGDYEIPAARRTTWSPGIPGGIPTDQTQYGSTILAATYNDGTDDATAGIQAAVNAAGAVATEGSPRFVLLGAGTFRINGTLNLNQDYVVLRGAGMGVTTLIKYGANNMIVIGSGQDWTGEANVVGSIAQGATSFTLEAGHGVQAGDMVVLDQVDDGSVIFGGATWWKRSEADTDGVNGPHSEEGNRSRGQVIHVGTIASNVLTPADGTVVHRAAPAANTPQVFRASTRRAGYIGIGLEDMTITGWYTYYGITVYWCKYCWVKGVECKGDGSPGTDGEDIGIFRSVRCEVRECYLHHSLTYITSRHAYGLSCMMQTSDCLIEDNIVFRKNKNITMEASGAGNVVAYNYLDDPVINAGPDTGWMEACLDVTHLSHPGYDLFEGNHTSRIAAGIVHGSASEQTFFRNLATGTRVYPLTDPTSQSAVMIMAGMYNMTLVGNVLYPDPAVGAIYEPVFENPTTYTYASTHQYKVRIFGSPEGDIMGPVIDTNVEATLLSVGNYDYVRSQIDEEPGATLPDSLYLTSAPAFMAGYTWPWVTADAATKYYSLPAKDRFDAM